MKVVILTLSSPGQKNCGNGTRKVFCHLRSTMGSMGDYENVVFHVGGFLK